MRHRYIILIISTLFIFCLSNFASAQEITESAPDWLNKCFDWARHKIIEPVKQGTQNLPEKVEIQTKNLLEKFQQEKQEKQEEIKQEIKSELKEKVKQWGQKWAEKIKGFLAPLKNKIQQGSTIIREAVNKVKDFLIDLFRK